ncbi:hypothetical protein FWK35_00002960, partial [Aphis craccivora]
TQVSGSRVTASVTSTFAIFQWKVRRSDWLIHFRCSIYVCRSRNVLLETALDHDFFTNVPKSVSNCTSRHVTPEHMAHVSASYSVTSYVCEIPNLPLSRPTPHTLIVCMGCVFNIVRFSGSINFNAPSSKSIKRSFPSPHRPTLSIKSLRPSDRSTIHLFTALLLLSGVKSSSQI